MEPKLSDSIIGYHYTNPSAYLKMKPNDEVSVDLDGNSGLVPNKRFINTMDAIGLPPEASEGVIEGLLEPEPQSWANNLEFPTLWRDLMHDLGREDEIILLGFEIKPSDEAYVVERAHFERELLREGEWFGVTPYKHKTEPFRKYWESRVSVFDYDGSYLVPQLTIWNQISYNRLKVEWVKPKSNIQR